MKNRSGRLLAVFVAGFMVLFSANLLAQENVGHIRGTVSAPTGAVIPNVTVTLEHEATGVVREVETNSAGAYVFMRLPLGEYTVRTRAEGFKSGERLLRIVSTVTQTADFALEIGDVTETVSVTAEVLTVDTSSNVVGTTRTTEGIAELPWLMTGTARNAVDFIRTMPGVIFDPNDVLTDQAFVSGAPQGGAAYQIDGLTASVSGHGQLRDNQNPAPEGFEEFRLTNNTNAEYGWNSGVQVSLVTKSGTNDFHGVLYHYLRNEALDSAGWLSGTVSKNKQNEWGLFVGGPLVKDRLFATFGYKGYRFRVEPSNATLSAPTPLMRQGDFSEWLGDEIGSDVANRPVFSGQIYDPLTTRSDGEGGFLRNPFLNNAIPQDRLSSIALFLQEPYPLPNLPGTLGNWIGSTLKNFNDLNRYQTKVDYYIDSQARHRVSFFYSHVDGEFQSPGTWPDPRVSSALGIIDGAYRTRMHYDWTVSPKLLFGLRAGFNRTPDSNLIAIEGSQTQGCDSGLQGLITCETPQIGFDNGATGMGFFFSNVRSKEQTLPAAADLNWTTGNHNIKIGVQYLSNVAPLNVTAFTNGVFNFTSRGTDLPGVGATGNGYASFLLGEVDNGQLWSGQDARWSTNTWGCYAQDSWRVRPKPTLNYGLRWDLFLPLREGYDRIANFDPNLPNPGMDGRPGAITFFGEGPGRNGRKAVWDIYKKAFSPRFGLAYTLTDKTLIRASYGLSTPAFFGLYSSGISILTTGFMSVRAGIQTDNNGVTPAFNWNDGVPDITGFFSGTLPNLDPAIANGFGHSVFFPEQTRPG